MSDQREQRTWAADKFPLHIQIFVSLCLAVLLGAVTDSSGWGGALLPALDFIGEFFLRSLKMLVLPLIVSSIIVGIAGVEDQRGMGKLGLVTACLYIVTSLMAILVGLVFVSWWEPGVVDGRPAKELVGLTTDMSAVLAQVEGKSGKDILSVFLRMVPENVAADAASGEMLGVIVFAILFGLALGRVDEGPRKAVVIFFRGIDQVMLRLTKWVLMISPLGVFALVGRVVLTTGWSALRPLSWLVLTVVAALSTHVFLVLPTLLLLVARKSPLSHFRALLPALLMAFSTASSAGTLPVTLESVRKSGVSERVASFTLPLGATVNMDGTALYECVAAIFIAQAYGIELMFHQLYVIALIALLTSIGVAGIPAASLVAISLILTSMGLPLEGLGLILAVDRILDMCRTSVNVLGDSVVAACAHKLVPERVTPTMSYVTGEDRGEEGQLR